MLPQATAGPMGVPHIHPPTAAHAMPDTPDKLAWDLLVELRKELLESQRIRTQVIGAKIALVSGALGLVAANLDKIPAYVAVLAVMAGLFFDLLIQSYSFSIKRIGFYVRHTLEPLLRSHNAWPADRYLWEEFVAQPRARQSLSSWGHAGLTVVASLAAIGSLFFEGRHALPPDWRAPLAVLLGGAIAFVYWLAYVVLRFNEASTTLSTRMPGVQPRS